MASETTITTARALIDGLQAHDLSRWADTLADNFTAEYPGAAGLNREQARMFNQAFLNAFLDLRFDFAQSVVNHNAAVFKNEWRIAPPFQKGRDELTTSPVKGPAARRPCAIPCFARKRRPHGASRLHRTAGRGTGARWAAWDGWYIHKAN